jgi:hypothetical protein
MGDVISLMEHPKQISLAAEFAAKLDRKLPTLEGDWSRKTFLLALLHNWERRYGHFLERLENPEFDPGDVTAWDFAMAISEITVRLSRYEGARK